tara:strand:+ start:126 stop:578 length:453 start_codon:yes stop_codon:yes gene_type:complete
MKIISHRGNIRGRVPSRENAPSYIDCAIGNGYDVEIDVAEYNGELWLGHDKPQYKITWGWIFHRQKSLWVHCKNVEAAKTCHIFQAFCHTNDPYTYTSNDKIWLHDLERKFDQTTIIPLLDWELVDSFKTHIKDEVPYGICTDYPYMLND